MERQDTLPAGGNITQVGLDSVLRAVGEKFIPRDLDRAALIRCIELCERRYGDAVRFKSKRHERIEIRKLEMIRKAAKRLEQLLGDVDLRQWAIGLSEPPPPEETLTTKQLVEAIDRELKGQRERDRSYADTFKKFSPFDWLVCVYLPDVYELNFRKAPGISVDSPYARFAESVLHELKILRRNGAPYKRATIARALSSARAGRIRRRMGSTESEFHHWGFSLVTRAYRNYPASTAAWLATIEGPTEPRLRIVDPEKFWRYLLDERDPDLICLLQALADDAAQRGIVVPGTKTVKVILPDDEEL
jgi:hypothetical protein